MDENKPNASTKDAPLSGRELLTAVRNILADNPERHNQGTWIANRFAPRAPQNLAEKLRKFARLPIPDEPADADEPVCGTTGCVAGWTAILGAPAGALITNGGIYLPDDREKSIAWYAADLLGLSAADASWMFAGSRDREELITALDAKIADPDANIGPDEDEENYW